MLSLFCKVFNKEMQILTFYKQVKSKTKNQDNLMTAQINIGNK